MHGINKWCGAALQDPRPLVFTDLVVLLSGNAVVSINVVTVRWARLVAGWVTVFGQVNYLDMSPTTQVNSAWPSLCGCAMYSCGTCLCLMVLSWQWALRQVLYVTAVFFFSCSLCSLITFPSIKTTTTVLHLFNSLLLASVKLYCNYRNHLDFYVDFLKST